MVAFDLIRARSAG